MFPFASFVKIYIINNEHKDIKKEKNPYICTMGLKITEQMNMQTIENLYKENRKQLKSFLYRLTTSKEDSEDLVQETFIKAQEKLSSFKGNSTIKTWLFAIAANLAKDHFRAKKRWAADAQDQYKKVINSDPENIEDINNTNRKAEHGKYEIKEHIDFCFTCIMKTLPIEQHIALMLADIYSFKVKEICDIMNLSQGVVKHLLHNGRTTMQSIFERRCALINKEGICNQCSELNGFNNPKVETQRIVAEMELVKAAQDPLRKDLFELRVKLVSAIDPLNASGIDLHEVLFKYLHKAMNEE